MTKQSNSTNHTLQQRQQLELGEMASQALANPIYGIIYNKMMADTITSIDAAKPEHTKEIMWAKQKRQVITEVFTDMSGMVDYAQRLYQQMQDENDPARQEQERINNQGFNSYGTGEGS